MELQCLWFDSMAKHDLSPGKNKIKNKNSLNIISSDLCFLNSLSIHFPYNSNILGIEQRVIDPRLVPIRELHKITFVGSAKTQKKKN